MIESILEHSIDISKLTKGWVLDLGCGTDFGFAKKMVEFGCKVICIDPNPRIVPFVDENIFFESKAIVSNNLKNIELVTYNDTDAATIISHNNEIEFLYEEDRIKVETITIEEIMKKYSVEFFDVIKFDIEGSEYELLMNMNHPISSQISVEFHDFRNMNPYYPDNEIYYDKLFKKIDEYYDIIKHQITNHPGFRKNNSNYWDSLFVLRTLSI